MSVRDIHPRRSFGARYRPAIQPWFSQVLRRSDLARRTGGRLTNHQLDLLSGRGIITIADFLQSAFSGLKGDPMVETRNLLFSTCLIDSGGYQISTGAEPYSDAIRYDLLRYSEKFEAAPILDGPTSSVRNKRSILRTVRDCLEFTIENARFAINNRRPGKTRLLNVIQGLNRRQALEWFEAVKFLNDPRRFGDRALEDWAFAGATRLHFSIVLTLIVMMLDQSLILPGAYIHFLGTGHPEIACLLTALQEVLRETVDPDVLVSFDSATPFLMAGKWKRAYGDFRWGGRQLVLPGVDLPSDESFIGSREPWPTSGPFADRLTIGDLVVRKATSTSGTWDDVSGVLVAAHNVHALSTAISDATEKLQLPLSQALRFLPSSLIEHVEVIREILRAERPFTLIQRHQTLLDSRAHKSRDTKLIDPWKGIDR
jgi:hypothetical protein